MKFRIETWTIQDIIDKYEDKSLILNPKYQRRFIWKLSDQKTLISSIFSGYAIPNIFLHSKGKKFEVVDGQQRLRTILGFYKKLFKNDENEEYDEKKMSKVFKSYQLPVTVIEKIENSESIEEFYSLVNSSGIHLNRPELKKAEYFDTNFLKLINELCGLEEFSSLNLFTDATTRRMNDIDFVSELVTLMILGITDKKQSVDKLFDKDINQIEYEKYKKQFKEVIKEFKSFNDYFPIKGTRFKQRNDFYTLFEFVLDHSQLNSKLLLEFYKILVCFGDYMVPSNEKCQPFQEYAFHCVSQSNSKSARDERKKIMNGILLNKKNKPNKIQKKILKFFGLTPDEGLKEFDNHLIFDKIKMNLESFSS